MHLLAPCMLLQTQAPGSPWRTPALVASSRVLGTRDSAGSRNPGPHLSLVPAIFSSPRWLPWPQVLSLGPGYWWVVEDPHCGWRSACFLPWPQAASMAGLPVGSDKPGPQLTSAFTDSSDPRQIPGHQAPDGLLGTQAHVSPGHLTGPAAPGSSQGNRLLAGPSKTRSPTNTCACWLRWSPTAPTAPGTNSFPGTQASTLKQHLLAPATPGWSHSSWLPAGSQDPRLLTHSSTCCLSWHLALPDSREQRLPAHLSTNQLPWPRMTPAAPGSQSPRANPCSRAGTHQLRSQLCPGPDWMTCTKLSTHPSTGLPKDSSSKPAPGPHQMAHMEPRDGLTVPKPVSKAWERRPLPQIFWPHSNATKIVNNQRPITPPKRIIKLQCLKKKWGYKNYLTNASEHCSWKIQSALEFRSLLTEVRKIVQEQMRWSTQKYKSLRQNKQQY